MGRRIATLLIILTLCLALSACGGTDAPPLPEGAEQGSPAPESSGSPFEGLPDSVSAVVEITVNPEFQLHLNGDGIIEKLLPMNEDAEAVCDGLSAEGMGYKEGTLALLRAAYDKGYITESSRVGIRNRFTPTEGFDPAMATDEIITEFCESVLDIGFDVQNEVAEREPQQDAEQGLIETMVDDTGSTVNYTYHENGQKATVEVIRPDGTTDLSVYSEDGTLLEQHYDNGSIGGSIYYYYEGDGKTRQEYSQTDGTSGTAYYENDVITLDENRYPDGTVTTTRYENGIPVGAERNFADGTHSVVAYSGGVAVSETTYAKGHTIKDTFYANGHVAETVDTYAHSGEEYIYRYDQSGTLTETYGYDNYGRRVHSVYNPDGSHISTVENEDGSTTTYSVDAGGTATKIG